MRWPLLLLIAGLTAWPFMAHATDLSQRLAGQILLQVEQNGEAWYLEPLSQERYFLSRPADAFRVMRELGLGIAHDELAVYLGAGFPDRLAGRILLDVEANGEAYYVFPNDLAGYYLGRPTDAFRVMRELGLGINDRDLAEVAVALASAPIPAATPVDEPALTGLTYTDQTITVASGDYRVRWLTADRARYHPLTATASTADCAHDCPAQSLADYISQSTAVAGINGSYFCPPDYASCADSANSYLWPVFDSARDRMLNESNLKFHERSLVAVDRDHQPTLYRNAKTEFGWSVTDFESRTGRDLLAALGNYPTLIDNDVLVAWNDPALDGSMKTSRVRRGAWGWNTDNHFLVVVDQATVPELAEVMQWLGATEAMNLDGGGSSALWFDGEYRVGPGRALPNVVLLSPIK